MKKYVFFFPDEDVETSNIVIVESIDEDNAFTNALKQMRWTDEEICELLDGNNSTIHFNEVYYKELKSLELPLHISTLDIYNVHGVEKTFDVSQEDCKCDGEREMVSAGGDAEDGPVTVTRCVACGKVHTQFGM